MLSQGSPVQAQPIKAGHAVAIQPSSASLTVPDAPRLALDQRTLSRQAFDAALAQKRKQAEVHLCTTAYSLLTPQGLPFAGAQDIVCCKFVL